jgi:hypothetical protein
MWNRLFGDRMNPNESPEDRWKKFNERELLKAIEKILPKIQREKLEKKGALEGWMTVTVPVRLESSNGRVVDGSMEIEAYTFGNQNVSCTIRIHSPSVQEYIVLYTTDMVYEPRIDKMMTEPDFTRIDVLSEFQGSNIGSTLVKNIIEIRKAVLRHYRSKGFLQANELVVVVRDESNKGKPGWTGSMVESLDYKQVKPLIHQKIVRF